MVIILVSNDYCFLDHLITLYTSNNMHSVNFFDSHQSRLLKITKPHRTGKYYYYYFLSKNLKRFLINFYTRGTLFDGIQLVSKVCWKHTTMTPRQDSVDTSQTGTIKMHPTIESPRVPPFKEIMELLKVFGDQSSRFSSWMTMTIFSNTSSPSQTQQAPESAPSLRQTSTYWALTGLIG